MTGSGRVEPGDLTAVAATDALFDRLNDGRPDPSTQPGGADPMVGVLSAWRAELDDRAATAMSTEMPLLPGRSRRWARAHRRTAAATAIVVALAGSTGVAAAASGPTGPLGGLHKLIWGDNPPVHHLDGLARAASNILDDVEARIRSAQAAGFITVGARSSLSADLDKADGFLNQDALPPQGLVHRLGRLRTALARIPAAVPTPPAVTDNHGGGGHGADDNGTNDPTSGTDGGGHGSDDGSGDGGGSTGSGDSSGGVSGDTGGGSDDGATSGSSDGSPGGGGDQTSSGDGGGSTSGSDDGGTTTNSGDGGGSDSGISGSDSASDSASGSGSDSASGSGTGGDGFSEPDGGAIIGD